MYKNFKSLLLFCILFATALLQTACKKQDKFPSQSLPDITSINPTSAIPGTSVDIRGVNFKAVTAVRFGVIEAVFDMPTDTSITAIVPDSLPAGNLYVQVYVGNGNAYAAKSFTVLQIPKIPAIYKITPIIAMPGTEVTITGINFTNITSVAVGNVSAVYTIVSDATLNFTIPNNIIGGKQVINISSSTGSDTASINIDLSPVISFFSPDTAKAGNNINVTGMRFTNTSSVLLGNLSTLFTVVNDTALNFNVPVNAVSGIISINTPNGSGKSVAELIIK